jgi:diguanylate cyclase (GGDEF)-like protein
MTNVLQEKTTVSLRTKMLAMAAIPLAVLLVAVTLAVIAQSEATRANEEVDRANAIRFTVAGIGDDLAVAEGAVRGFLLTDRPGLLEQHEDAIAALELDLDELDRLVINPLQVRRLDRLHELVDERIETLREVTRLGQARNDDEQERLETWLLHGQTITEALRGLTQQMEDTASAEAEVLVRRRDAAFERSYIVEALAMPAAMLVAMLLMLGFTAGLVRRISMMQANARRLEQGLPLHEPDASQDELGSLSHALVRTGNSLFELQEELRHLATEDPLTGLANRRGFDPLAQHELLVAARTRRAVALLFVDIDGLKQVNDELGHSVGDAMIVETAEVLKETIRVSDLAARLGGDEFCVLLIGDPDLDADRVVERLRESEAQHNARHGRQYRLSLSIGVSHLETGRRAVTLEELMDAADELMYADKRKRRKGAPIVPEASLPEEGRASTSAASSQRKSAHLDAASLRRPAGSRRHP